MFWPLFTILTGLVTLAAFYPKLFQVYALLQDWRRTAKDDRLPRFIFSITWIEKRSDGKLVVRWQGAGSDEWDAVLSRRPFIGWLLMQLIRESKHGLVSLEAPTPSKLCRWLQRKKWLSWLFPPVDTQKFREQVQELIRGRYRSLRDHNTLEYAAQCVGDDACSPRFAIGQMKVPGPRDGDEELGICRGDRFILPVAHPDALSYIAAHLDAFRWDNGVVQDPDTPYGCTGQTPETYNERIGYLAELTRSLNNPGLAMTLPKSIRRPTIEDITASAVS